MPGNIMQRLEMMRASERHGELCRQLKQESVQNIAELTNNEQAHQNRVVQLTASHQGLRNTLEGAHENKMARLQTQLTDTLEQVQRKTERLNRLQTLLDGLQPPATAPRRAA